MLGGDRSVLVGKDHNSIVKFANCPLDLLNTVIASVGSFDVIGSGVFSFTEGQYRLGESGRWCKITFPAFTGIRTAPNILNCDWVSITHARDRTLALPRPERPRLHLWLGLAQQRLLQCICGLGYWKEI